jgi:hypothetical protein
MDKNHEIGTATHVVSVVDRFVGALFRVRGKSGGEMSTGRHPERTDLLRIDSPLFSL